MSSHLKDAVHHDEDGAIAAAVAVALGPTEPGELTAPDEWRMVADVLDCGVSSPSDVSRSMTVQIGERSITVKVLHGRKHVDSILDAHRNVVPRVAWPAIARAVHAKAETLRETWLIATQEIP